MLTYFISLFSINNFNPTQLPFQFNPENMTSYQTFDQNNMNTDDYEEVETLSLCDLPIYSSGGGGSFESKEEYHSSSSDDQEDFFEFFSGELDTATNAAPSTFTTTTTTYADDIIFCGKLIPYKIPPVHHIINKNQLQQQQQQLPIKKQRRQMSFLQWNSKAKTGSRILKDTTPTTKKSKCGVASSANKKYAGQLILTSAAKSKWHMFLFGLTRIPTEMELSDMKNRQHRRTPSSPIRYPSFDETNKDKGVTTNASKKISSSTTSSGKGLWKLLKVMCCKNKASAGCI